MINWGENRPDISDDPRTLGQEVPVIFIIFHQAMGQIYVMNAVNAHFRGLPKSDDVLSGAGVAYLKHSLNMASM